MKYAITLMLLAGCAVAADYTSTITVVETDAIRTTTDGRTTTTTCTAYVPGQFDCTSVSPSITTVQLIQVIKVSDGKTYAVTCADSVMRRFAHGFASGSGATVVSGCRVPSGDYKARWDNGTLAIAHGKKETKFYLVASVPTPAVPAPQR